MFREASRKKCLKITFTFFVWFTVMVAAYLPAQTQADLCVSSDENWRRREKTAFAVAGLTVFALAGAVAWLGNGSGHHKHRGYYSSYYSDDYHYSSDYSYWHNHSYSSDHHHHDSDHHHHDSDHHHHSSDHHHHDSDYHYESGFYSSNPYSIFSENDVSSWGSDSDNNERNRFFGNAKIAKTSASKPHQSEDRVFEGKVIASPAASSRINKSVTAFVQLPDGSSRMLGSLPLSGNASIPFGPFEQKGVYTFGMSLDQDNESSMQIKLATIEMEVNGSTVQRVEFNAPPHAPARYEPAPCCFDFSGR